MRVLLSQIWKVAGFLVEDHQSGNDDVVDSLISVFMYATVFDLHSISIYVPIHTTERKNSQRLLTSEGRPKLGWHGKQLPLFTYKYLVMSNVPSYPGAVSYTLVTVFVYARPGHDGHLYKRKMTYTFLSPRRFLSHTL